MCARGKDLVPSGNRWAAPPARSGIGRREEVRLLLLLLLVSNSGGKITSKLSARTQSRVLINVFIREMDLQCKWVTHSESRINIPSVVGIPFWKKTRTQCLSPDGARGTWGRFYHLLQSVTGDGDVVRAATDRQKDRQIVQTLKVNIILSENKELSSANSAQISKDINAFNGQELEKLKKFINIIFHKEPKKYQVILYCNIVIL